ncbi:MAG: sensor domain-containing diguanylate cyclase [Syntrophaceae bacterium]|nr:sensor domain-containing diguanylate cyclase [Syntrophaceae bacterium]
MDQPDQKLVQLERKLFDLSSLLQAGKAFDNLLGVRELYSVFTSIVGERFGLETYALFIVNDDGSRFELVQGIGLSEELPADFSFPADEGLLWQAILQGRPFATVDSLGEPRFAIPFDKHRLSGLMSRYFIPLVHRGRVVGLLSIGPQKNTRSYMDDDLEFLHILAEQAAVSIITAKLYEKNEADMVELNKTVKNLSILYNIGRAMNHIGDLKNLLKFILQQAIETTEAQKGSLMLFDQQTRRLVVHVVNGLPDKKTEEAINTGLMSCRTFAVGEGIAGKVFEKKEAIIVNAAEKDDRYLENRESNVESILCIPLVVADEAIGVINITNKKSSEGIFTSEDLELLDALGNQAAVAINNTSLYEMAITDELTGLYIRRYFNVKLESEFRRARRYGHRLTLAMCDLDHFKRVNDSFGHQMGDTVLQAVAGLFKMHARESDIPARFGGEEFAVILPETAGEGGTVFGERIRNAVAGKKIEGFPHQITISIGLATFPDDADSIQTLIRAADSALYDAKERGRNQVQRFQAAVSAG